ncbi:MAG: protein kinase [Pseudomonadota bacterium]
MATDDIDVSGETPESTVPLGTMIIDTYEIEHLVNVGGMGEVYRARNIHTDDPVAIKIVLPALAHDPKIIALFQKEAQVLGRLYHDSIVRYHTFTLDKELGRPCLIMEFVEGESIYDRLENGPMPEEDVRALIRRVGGGLHAAHKAGTVHRDLTPGNVILTDGLVEHAKIIDFGIAKSTKMGTGTVLQGQFAGTLNFVSPEQLGDYGGEIDARSDIYSLGLLVAAACKGGTLDMGSTVVEAVNKRRGVPDLTGVYDGLRPLISNMLEPDPANRPGSMEEVIALMDVGPSASGAVDHAATPQPDRTIIMPLQSVPPTSSQPPASGGSPSSVPPQSSQPPAGTGAPAGLGAPPETSALGQATAAVPAPAPTGPTNLPPPTRDAPPPQRSGSSPGIIIGIILLAAIGGGYVAYTQGLLPFGPEQVAAVDFPPEGPEDYPPVGLDDYPPEGPEDYPPDGPLDYLPVGPDDFPPEGPEDYAPAGEEDFAPEGSDDYPPVGVADYAPEGPEDYAPEGPEDYAPAGPEDCPPAGPECEQAPVGNPLETIAQHLAFLDAYNTGECTLTIVAIATEPRVALTAYGTTQDPFEGLVGDFESAREAQLDVGVRIVKPTQCPVLEFASDLDTAPDSRPHLTLDRDVLISGQTISGEAKGYSGREVWFFLVDSDGKTHTLNSLLRSEPDGGAKFSFQARLTEDSEPAPQVIGLLVSDQPLSTVQAAEREAQSQDLLPNVLSEIREKEIDAHIAVQFFRLEE